MNGNRQGMLQRHPLPDYSAGAAYVDTAVRAEIS